MSECTEFKLMPIGGVGETGALNSMLYQAGETAFVIDAGVGFVDDRFPGANLIVPDYTALESVRDNLKGLVLTHGHEDHIGSVPHFLKEYEVPVYGTAFTIELIQQKLEEYNIYNIEFIEIKAGEPFQIGDVKIEPVFVNHSIMDTVALFCDYHGKTWLHLTDFKIDPEDPEKNSIDLKRIGEIGNSGLDLLLMDSTNVFSKGETKRELDVRESLYEQIEQVKGRVIICLFSSNTFRLQSLIDCAKRTGRKIAITGRSTRSYIAAAREISRIDFKGVGVYDIEDIKQFDDSEIMVLSTGSQGEGRAVLQRMSRDMFKPFRIKSGDTILMSSKMIPGNEGRIFEMMNRLSLLGAEIITAYDEPMIHASGHAYQKELDKIFQIAKPKFFVPIHGEYRHLKKHEEIAIKNGMQKEQVMVVQNGETVIVNTDGIFRGDYYPVGRKYYDDEKNEITKKAIKIRKNIAFNGVIFVSAVFDKQVKNQLETYELISQGMLGGEIEKTALFDCKDYLDIELACINKLTAKGVKKFFENEVRNFYKQQFHLRPEVYVIVHEI